MVITTPSGYKVTFKSQEDLTYGERRQIQKAMMSGMKLDPKQSKDVKISGDMVFDGQDAALRVILKSIEKPIQQADGTITHQAVTGDLFDEVMSWKNQQDGDMVYEVVNDSINTGDNEQKKSLTETTSGH